MKIKLLSTFGAFLTGSTYEGSESPTKTMAVIWGIDGSYLFVYPGQYEVVEEAEEIPPINNSGSSFRKLIGQDLKNVTLEFK